MIDIMLTCFKTLLILTFLPLELIIKLICMVITFIIGIIYVLIYPLVKTCRVPKTLEKFCQYSIKIKGGFKITKKVIELWS